MPERPVLPISEIERVFREEYGRAVAVLVRVFRDITIAEEAVQDAFTTAVQRWPSTGLPASPAGWIITTARNRAIDRLRREASRDDRHAQAALLHAGSNTEEDVVDDDRLRLIFTCCHPALAPSAQVALTLRLLGGLTTAEIARAFLVPEPAMAQRLIRAKRKIRQAGISLRVPAAADLPGRLSGVLRVVYLVFTEGHMATSGDALIRTELCEQAIRLARALAGLVPGEPEVTGLLALLLLTDARRAARLDSRGDLVLLPDQDRRQWDAAMIAEGERLVEQALRAGRPGRYQLHAAIAACHSGAPSAAETDWRQIALLYGELLRYEPTPVTQANRAVAVAMAAGPEAGLAILDAVGGHPRLARWPQLHIARAELLRLLGRHAEALAAYQAALRPRSPAAERSFIGHRISELSAG